MRNATHRISDRTQRAIPALYPSIGALDEAHIGSYEGTGWKWHSTPARYRRMSFDCSDLENQSEQLSSCDACSESTMVFSEGKDLPVVATCEAIPS